MARLLIAHPSTWICRNCKEGPKEAGPVTGDGHGKSRRDTSPSLRLYRCPCPSTSVPIFVTLFMFLRKLNDPVDRLRSKMICCLGWTGREIRKHQRDVRNLEVRTAAEADL